MKIVAPDFMADGVTLDMRNAQLMTTDASHSHEDVAIALGYVFPPDTPFWVWAELDDSLEHYIQETKPTTVTWAGAPKTSADHRETERAIRVMLSTPPPLSKIGRIV